MYTNNFIEIYLFQNQYLNFAPKGSAYDSLINILKNKGLHITYEDIQISEKGKPYILNKDLFFNISYTDSMYAIGLSDNEIGVDIEKIRNGFKESIIAKRVFSNGERKYIKEGDSRKRFFEIWTMREAYVKYLGVGIDGGFFRMNILDIKKRFNIETRFVGDIVISVCSDFKTKVNTIICDGKNYKYL